VVPAQFGVPVALGPFSVALAPRGAPVRLPQETPSPSGCSGDRNSAYFPGKRRQATACWEGGRNSLLESAQEATPISVAISANQRQSSTSQGEKQLSAIIPQLSAFFECGSRPPRMIGL
jgi:hypothetical protein